MSSLHSTSAHDFSDAAFAGVRNQFPALETLTYINSGSYGLLAAGVREAIGDYIDLRIRKGADWDEWVERSFRVGGLLARLINADPEEVAVTASASSGINSIASALDFSGEKNRVVLSNYEFPTSGQIWHAQEPRGAVVDHIGAYEEGAIPVEAFARAIDDRTRIVVLSRVCYRHGARFSDDDVREIVALAHRHGAYVILDCFQSLGAEVLDVKALGVDFVIGGMYKYLLGTAGSGYLYTRRELTRTLVPTVSGWFAQERIGDMNIFANDPSHTATRFQGGTPPVLSCYAAEAGLKLILDYGAEAIEARVRSLTAYAWQRFEEEGYRVLTPAEARGPMIAIRVKDSGALVQALIDRNIVTSHRDGNLRAGFHFYNDRDDVERLIAAINENPGLLA